ncbi:putative porin [Flavobacterium sp. JP2137]|uniref:putative porin n=1 Tax=Flavobacterium sp. JP2137 TaxID=3414510 RepID=UPI003D2FF1AF
MQKYLFVLMFFVSLGLAAQNKTRDLSRSNKAVNAGARNGLSTANSNSANPNAIDTKGNDANTTNGTASTKSGGVAQDSVAPVADYKIISLRNDTIAVDTALSLKKYYAMNYLRKDEFGLLPFANEGQTYNVLNYGAQKNTVLPSMGFNAKHSNYLEIEDIHYYTAPTPYTDLYYRSVMKQGQTLDAFVTVNTSKNLNFFVGYKGMRSLGKYINQLGSTGNFKIGSSYISNNKRYSLRTHITAQDILNQENGGITDLTNFESSEAPFDKRDQLNVYFRDVETLLKGKRLYVNHQYQLNSSFKNGILLTHELTYEDKFFNYYQSNALAGGVAGEPLRFGNFFQSEINNTTKYYQFNNKLGAAYQSDLLGRFEFFTEFLKYDYRYNSLAIINNELVPDHIQKNITMLGGKYTYHKNRWKGTLLVANSLGNDDTSNIEADLRYHWNDRVQMDFGFQQLNKTPDLNYQLFQSDYVNYNWCNQFNNEKITQFTASATTPWLNISAKYEVINDKIYFTNTAKALNEEGMPVQLLVKPTQYDGTINYLSIQANKDLRVGKWGLDNTVLYQHVDQSASVLNVPEVVLRSTLYYTDAFFDQALKFQTGVTLNYFSSYYGNDYNPLIGDFYVQDQRKMGDYPVLDFFINLKVRTARIYLKAEHFNSSMTGYNFYSAPNYPYRDFIIRFGLVWNFFT